MSDYISRQDAIDTIHKTIYEIFGYQDGKVFTDTDELLLMVNKLLCKNIREIPAADVVERKTNEWIPCRERLPEEGQDILAYRVYGEDERIIPANYSNGCWFDCHMNCSAEHIVAWMPLPKPYSGADMRGEEDA